MRTARDRIRHAISFEIIGLALITPLGAWAFHLPMHDIGVVGIVGATIATLWNYVYNLGFDHIMQGIRGGTRKTTLIRVLHAVMFEVGLLVVLLPLFAWYLGISPWQAFLMDVSFALFYMGYAFVFSWAYDRLFPLLEWQKLEAARSLSTGVGRPGEAVSFFGRTELQKQMGCQ
jgi:uncharacterized membrane protein